MVVTAVVDIVVVCIVLFIVWLLSAMVVAHHMDSLYEKIISKE